MDVAVHWREQHAGSTDVMVDPADVMVAVLAQMYWFSLHGEAPHVAPIWQHPACDVAVGFTMQYSVLAQQTLLPTAPISLQGWRPAVHWNWRFRSGTAGEAW